MVDMTKYREIIGSVPLAELMKNEDDIHLHLIFQLPEIFYSKGQINNKVQFCVQKFKHLPPIEVIKELKNPCNYFVIFNLEN